MIPELHVEISDTTSRGHIFTGSTCSDVKDAIVALGEVDWAVVSIELKLTGFTLREVVPVGG